MPSTDRYREAARRIPPGETRTYLELCAEVGRSGAARAAARSLRLAGDEVPWHRVVPARGLLPDADPRAATQLARLRAEGARPRGGESVRAFPRRVGADLVGDVSRRRWLPADDERVERFPSRAAEPFASEEAARSRGFFHADVGPPPVPPVPEVPAATAARLGGEPCRPAAIAARARALPPDFAEALAARGGARVAGFLAPDECEAVLAAATRFERSVDMGAFGYGHGAYHYLAEPPAEPVRSLRAALYERLVDVAADHGDFPPTLAELWERGAATGQRRGSTILLCCGEGGVNHLHRDVYGKTWFPYQALVCLSRRGTDFDGGELVLAEEHGTELRRRTFPVDRGDLVVFATTARLERRGRRRRRVEMRHGMTRVGRGARYALGVVFPPAR